MRHRISILLVVFLAACATGPEKALPRPGVVLQEMSRRVILDRTISSYRKIAEKGGWPVVPPGPKLQRGDEGERVTLLRKRLKASGDLKKGNGALFDENLDVALSRFQERHGLEPTGILDESTLTALNIPVEERIRQLEINQERLKEFKDLGKRYVIVNIPDFRLKVIESGTLILEMRVVVGLKKEWQTPLLSSQITYLILNPKWHVPPDIFKKEVLRKLREDPEYLAKENMVVLRTEGNPGEIADPATIDWNQIDPEAPQLKIVQREGPGNSLGRIKFMFPNRYAVYLHDTPSKSLFKRRMRALSHGCVRVENPLELAEFLMKDDSSWTRESIEKAIRGGRNQTVTLPEKIPVYIVYLTAWVDEKGLVQFRDDIYGKDQEIW